jgi:hypothetical protein
LRLYFILICKNYFYIFNLYQKYNNMFTRVVKYILLLYKLFLALVNYFHNSEKRFYHPSSHSPPPLSLILLPAGANVIKLFLSVIYGFYCLARAFRRSDRKNLPVTITYFIICNLRTKKFYKIGPWLICSDLHGQTDKLGWPFITPRTNN